MSATTAGKSAKAPFKVIDQLVTDPVKLRYLIKVLTRYGLQLKSYYQEV